MKTATIRQTVKIPATPARIYKAWLSSKEHAAMTGVANARQSARVGARHMAADDYMWGTNLALVKDRLIVQSWRTVEFPKSALDSRLTITLAPDGKAGTRLTLIHAGLPASQRTMYASGWREYYWTPMKAYFAALRTK
jgi:uncharacterized protein YndB with AHSA1/START domain